MSAARSIAAVLLLSCCAFAQAQPSPAQLLQATFVREWDYEMQRNPVWASLLGDRRYNDRWDDLTPEAIAHDHQHDVAVLEQLRKIDRARLSPKDQLNYDLFRRMYQTWVDEYRFRWYLLPESQLSGLPEGLHESPGVQAAAQLADNLRFENEKDYRDWIARMQRFPAYVAQVIALMREGMRAKMVHPRVIMQRVPEQIRAQMVGNAEDSGFYKPFKHFPKAISEKDQKQFEEEARTAITERVIPALGQFESFLTSEYLPAATDEVGIWQLPQGEAMYASFVRRETTTNLTPEQIHALGLAEVERIRQEMEEVKQKSGFQGTLPEFFTFLRSDSRFYYHDPQELLLHYRNVAKQVDPQLVRVFATLPRMPYGVDPIPSEIAPDSTTAYYFGPAADGSRAGTYFVNLYKPETRPKWEMVPLTLHESVPGHHLQIALAMEQKDIPNFRRYGSYTAYVEGWGLYAESLGEEMGLYGDPYDKFGQLAYEMWRAVRLVVDTGMHAKRWSREKATDYMVEATGRPRGGMQREIDRYCVWPGQACSYKVGHNAWERLRDEARARQGERFDIRQFHEVLRRGRLPLVVLEQVVKTTLV